ncbi:MAG TPA: homoserine O-succinyltransferase [Steroidobacteraceae bacterium]|jgi:homoserine O-succinyltransferase
MTSHEEANAALVIGLVNNMPDGALKATERQFRDLLAAAAGNTPWRLRLFTLPEATRSEATSAYISENYEKFDALWTSRLDGLIVTGTEPRTPALANEPYWGTLTRLVDWAEEHTASTVWSCLAAHAAVLYLDGIERRRLAEKLSGVFECVRGGRHAILSGGPDVWCIPHSRLNDLPQGALSAAGYEILSHSALAGADLFIKPRKSLFVFLQGHPEYDADSLLREYHRDIGRYLRGERDDYPQLPRGYFTGEVAAAMAAFRERALAQRHIDTLADFPAVDLTAKSAHRWRPQALLIYANWLALLARRRRGARAHAL